MNVKDTPFFYIKYGGVSNFAVDNNFQAKKEKLVDDMSKASHNFSNNYL